MLRWSTQIHKWLGLVVGLQVLGWVLGGLVMTAIPIERVRSEHRYAAFRPQPLPVAGLLTPGAASSAAGVQPVEAMVKTTLRGAVWVLKDSSGKSHVINALTGVHMAPLGESEAKMLGVAVYQGPGKAVRVRSYREAPQETGREGPIWRVDFDDPERTAFYLSPETGEVVSRRSNVWRFYDFFWRVHILDFKTGDNFNHPLIIAAAAATLPMVLTGLILLWIRLGRDVKGARARRQRAVRA